MWRFREAAGVSPSLPPRQVLLSCVYIFNPSPTPVMNHVRAVHPDKSAKKISTKNITTNFLSLCILFYTMCLSTPDAVCLGFVSCKSDSKLHCNPIKLQFPFLVNCCTSPVCFSFFLSFPDMFPLPRRQVAGAPLPVPQTVIGLNHTVTLVHRSYYTVTDGQRDMNTCINLDITAYPMYERNFPSKYVTKN